MPGTAAQVEQSAVAMTGQTSAEFGEFGALRMHVAMQIGLRLRPELRSDMRALRSRIGGVGNRVHCSAPNNHG